MSNCKHALVVRSQVPVTARSSVDNTLDRGVTNVIARFGASPATMRAPHVALCGLAAAVHLLCATDAGAAEADDGAAANASDDTVVVTGQRSAGRRTVLDTSAPIDVLPNDILINTGKQNLKDALVAVAPSFAHSPGGARGQQGAAVKTAGLRGLGPGETLVLINGKRRHGMALTFIPGRPQSGQSPTDLDMIPTSAVQRVEILRDGASAQYGSDAIAGVINVILKSNVDGGEASIAYGQNSEGVGSIDNMGRNRRAMYSHGLSLGREDS